MFMGKVEWQNTIQLLKIRNKESQVAKGFFLLLLALWGIDLFTVIQKVREKSLEVIPISYQTYSMWAFVLILICILLISISYSDYNRNIQIFPQSNKSRFVSYGLFCYLIFLKVLFFSIGLYLIQYGTGAVLTQIYDNVEFVYNFNIFYIVSGLLVNIVYGFIIISFIILLSALDRKFRIIFRVVAVGLFLIVYQAYNRGNQILNGFFHFIVGESSIIIFAIKGTILILLLIVASLLVNEKTKYHQTNKEFKLYKIVIGIATGLTVYMVISFLSISNTNMESSIVEVKQEPRISYGSDATKNYQYKVDVSQLEDGSTIILNLPKVLRGRYSLYYDTKATNSFNDEILIDFNPERKFIDWVDMNQFTDVELVYSLDGNTLNLNVVSKDSVKVLFLSPFSYMWQFDYFKGKQIYKEIPGSMGGSGGGNISIFLPESKNLKVSE